MNERLFAVSFSFKHIGKIDKMAEVMNTAAGYKAILTSQIQLAYKVIEQTGVHLFVEHKPNGFTLAPVLYPFFNFLNNGGRDVAIHVYFGVFCYFKHPTGIAIVA